jgi:uncharacterized protein
VTETSLNDVDVRVLGALIEKEMTTPDYYPLSLNALTHACNQSSNREPVVSYDEDTVTAAITRLRHQSLVRGIQRADSRVTKYQHLAAETMSVSAQELAVLCVLMLRGPQTLAEIRTRSARLLESVGPSDVEATLNSLIERHPAPLAARLSRQPGQKEGRYAHMLSGEVTFDVPDAAPAASPGNTNRMTVIEETLAELRNEIADLRAQLDSFRKQFE